MKALDMVMDFFFPTTCIFCKKGSRTVCDRCFVDIPQSIFFYNNTLSIYSFKNKQIDELLWKLKYHHTNDIALLFGSSLSKGLEEKLLRNFSSPETLQIYLVPIPLSSGDKRIHNHSELLADQIKINLPNYKTTVIQDLLIKNTKVKQAHLKNRKERLENLENNVTVNAKSADKVNKNNALFVLVDDVTTTGATINESRKALSNYLQISGEKIFAITVAH